MAGDCSSDNVFTLPSSVNKTLFHAFLSKGLYQNAFLLLPPEYSVNLTEIGTPTEKNCTFTERRVDASLEETLIAVYGWVLALTSVLGVIGNLIVILVYVSKLKSLTPYKWSLVHLACCDLTFAALGLLIAIPTLQTKSWQHGIAGCKALKSLSHLGSMVAVGIMLVIAMERYFAVSKPLNRGNRGKRTGISVAIVWFVSVGAIVPVAIASRLVKSGDGLSIYCEERWDHSGLTKIHGIVYAYSLVVFFYLIPLMLIGFVYGRIINRLRTSGNGKDLYAFSSPEAIEKRQKSQRKRVKVLVCLVSAFAVCVLPRRIFSVVSQHLTVEDLPLGTFHILIYLCILPYPFHVAVNPIIYSLVDPKFRQRLGHGFIFLMKPFLVFRNKIKALGQRKLSSGSASSVSTWESSKEAEEFV